MQHIKSIKALNFLDLLDFFTYDGSNYNVVRKLTRELQINDLRCIAESEKLKITETSPASCFKDLIRKLNQKHDQKLVVLVDEYDTPLTDNLRNQELAEENRKVLSSFFKVLKDMDEYIHFIFITGVNKFSKTSIFSALNSLEDITLNPNFANICSFTYADLDSLFKEHLFEALKFQKSEALVSQTAKICDLRKEILKYYDGYSWDGQSRVLNPFSLLNFFKSKKLDSYWYNTGTFFSV